MGETPGRSPENLWGQLVCELGRRSSGKGKVRTVGMGKLEVLSSHQVLYLRPQSIGECSVKRYLVVPHTSKVQNQKSRHFTLSNLIDDGVPTIFQSRSISSVVRFLRYTCLSVSDSTFLRFPS